LGDQVKYKEIKFRRFNKSIVVERNKNIFKDVNKNKNLAQFMKQIKPKNEKHL